MNISAFQKATVRIIKPVALFTLTALTACGLNLAGTDEQENTIAKGPDVSVNTGTDAPPSSSTSSADTTPTLDYLITKILDNDTFYTEHFTVEQQPSNNPDADPIVPTPSSSASSAGSPDPGIVVNGEKGVIIYNSHSAYASITCNAGEGLHYSYSVHKFESYVIKEYLGQSAEAILLFKTDCDAELGKYELKDYDNAQCIIDTPIQSEYVDTYWKKYSLAVIGHCQN